MKTTHPPRDSGPGLLDHLKSWPLALLPHQLLSRFVRRITRCRTAWVKNLLIRTFMQHFRVDLSESMTADATAFADFNSFFTRALRPEARPLSAGPDDISSPVDGYVSQIGTLNGGQILQAKGREYSLVQLLGGDPQRASPFLNGSFATLYLSPRDYHRIHMPVDGQLVETVYVPGRLYSVAPHTTRAIPGLFTRNERLVCLFDTATGPMALVMVGAIFVSCMETIWDGVANPHMRRLLMSRRHDAAGLEPVRLARGDEMGRFNMGSTVILLFSPGAVSWDRALAASTPVRMGEPLGSTG